MPIYVTKLLNAYYLMVNSTVLLQVIYLINSHKAYSAMYVGVCGSRRIIVERLRINPRNVKFIHVE